MDIKALADDVGLTVKAIRFLEKHGAVDLNNLNEDHIFFMHTLSTIWGKEEFVRMQVAPLSTSRRAKVIGAGLTDIERRILYRWLFHYSDREDSGISLHVSQVVDEVIHHLKLPPTMRHEVTVTAYKMRKKVCNLRYRGTQLKEIANLLLEGERPTRRKMEAQRTTTKARMQAQAELLGYG